MITLGAGSIARLGQVHPRLVAVVRRAAEISAQDFGITEGERSMAQQLVNVAKGVSRTKASLHLIQPDGFAHAVDATPYEGGGFRWEWPLIYPVASAFAQAGRELDTPLRWGGVWDRALLALDSRPDALKAEVAAYALRHPGPDLLDGPHYELLAP